MNVLHQFIIEILNYLQRKKYPKVFRQSIFIPAAFYIKVRKSLVDYPGNVCYSLNNLINFANYFYMPGFEILHKALSTSRKCFTAGCIIAYLSIHPLGNNKSLNCSGSQFYISKRRDRQVQLRRFPRGDRESWSCDC